jgi:hypothetical protein
MVSSQSFAQHANNQLHFCLPCFHQVTFAMKTFSAASLVMALALMPSAWAETIVMSYYSDSTCETAQSVSATASPSCTSSDACTQFPQYDNVYYKLACSDSSPSDLIGDNEGWITYSDSTCETSSVAYWEATDQCYVDAMAVSSYFQCVGSNVNYYTCTSADCADCTALPYSTTCTVGVDGSSSYKGQSTSCSSTSDDVCFSGDDSVTLESGATKIFSELAIGDMVQTADASGALSFSNVVALPHAANNKLASFVNVVTASGKSLKATKMHLLQQCDGSLAYAGSLSEGDCLRTVDGGEAVTALSTIKAEGIYTAVTTNEFLVVNGIVASPFAVTHSLVNSFYILHRSVAKFMPTALASPLVLAVNAFLGGSFLAAGNSK